MPIHIVRHCCCYYIGSHLTTRLCIAVAPIRRICEFDARRERGETQRARETARAARAAHRAAIAIVDNAADIAR